VHHRPRDDPLLPWPESSAETRLQLTDRFPGQRGCGWRVMARVMRQLWSSLEARTGGSRSGHWWGVFWIYTSASKSIVCKVLSFYNYFNGQALPMFYKRNEA
jgi:hypothetical protein